MNILPFFTFLRSPVYIVMHFLHAGFSLQNSVSSHSTSILCILFIFFF